MFGKFFFLAILFCLPLQAVDIYKQQRRAESETMFQVNCSICHSEAVALDGNHNLPSDIHCLLDRMVGNHGAQISPEVQEEIAAYLIYYAATEHEEEVNDELENLRPDIREREAEHIRRALEMFE